MTTSEPLISVVIPTWNRRAMLQEAVRSVLAQSYARLELIVVDDGSTDGTVERIRALAEPRVRVVVRPHSGNIGSVRNEGVAASKGELIAFLDSDDLWLPRKLELQVQALHESQAGWCYCGYAMIDSGGRVSLMKDGFKALSGPLLRDLLTAEASPTMSTLMVRRDVFERAGPFSEDMRLHEDRDLYFRLAPCANAIAVPDILAHIREHPGRNTALRPDRHERTALVYERFLAGRPDDELGRLARRYWTRELSNGAAKHLARGDLKRGARLFARSLANGAELRHWAHAVWRGVRGAMRPRALRG